MPKCVENRKYTFRLTHIRSRFRIQRFAGCRPPRCQQPSIGTSKHKVTVRMTLSTGKVTTEPPKVTLLKPRREEVFNVGAIWNFQSRRADRMAYRRKQTVCDKLGPPVTAQTHNASPKKENGMLPVRSAPKASRWVYVLPAYCSLLTRFGVFGTLFTKRLGLPLALCSSKES